MNDKWIQLAMDSQFRESQWGKLTFEERLSACQQLENRLANERGAVPRNIYCRPLDGGTFGYQSGDRIVINSYILRDNAFHTENGPVKIPAVGWQMYDTICHEDLHGMQEDLGTGQTFTYVSPDRNYDIYRIQHDEKYAYAIGQHRTLEAIIELKNYYGLEPDMIEYKDVAKANRYQDAVEEAAKSLGIEDIDHVLDKLINDKEQGINPIKPDNDYRRLDNLLYNGKYSLEDEDEGQGESQSNGMGRGTLSLDNLIQSQGMVNRYPLPSQVSNPVQLTINHTEGYESEHHQSQEKYQGYSHHR